VFEQMAGPDGSLRITDMAEDDRSTFEAKVEAHNRLSGALFGPTPSPEFNWTFDSLLQQVSDRDRELLESSPVYQNRFNEFLKQKIDEEFSGSRKKLLNAVSDKQLTMWYELFFQLEIDPPSRQTCLVITLNEPVMKEFARAVGRPLMGKPRGRILELAIGESGIAPENLHMGGPPSDNVAIDEEGTITLQNLIGLSAMIGITLAYLSFRNVRITIMLFFTGGVSAMASLAYVWFGGMNMDAILMSMPSLIYVLGLSGAVHIVNYYRDACHEFGHKLAVERAIGHSWFPCLLAAFTTALGLGSLMTSKLAPIWKFGCFSAIATMATVIILFTYLPAALVVFKPGYTKQSKKQRETGGSDYRWLEKNLGELVPAEVVVSIDRSDQQEVYLETLQERQRLALDAERLKKEESGEFNEAADEVPAIASSDASDGDNQAAQDTEEPPPFIMTPRQKRQYALRLSMLERVELSSRVRELLQLYFGDNGLGIVGSGMSTDVFVPLNQFSTTDELTRRLTSAQLYKSRPQMLEQQYLAVADDGKVVPDQQVHGRELWRINVLLAALSDVDYGRFISDMKSVIEPIDSAYRYRKEIFEKIHSGSPDQPLREANILVLGGKPEFSEEDRDIRAKIKANVAHSELVDQTLIFSDTLRKLFNDRGIAKKSKSSDGYLWIDPQRYSLSNPELKDKERLRLQKFFAPESWKSRLASSDCVVLVEDSDLFDVEFIKEHANKLVDCRDHEFLIDHETKTPFPGMKTATQRKQAGEEVGVTTIYTGIIPIVYKAQRALLTSLIQSIGLAFVMITVVMMLLLRDWNRPWGKGNRLNIRGGLLAMIPNVFPVVVVFGVMSYRGIKVDIGSMMTASVAMGVAVDDTIHFLNWYRGALAKGLDRIAAIRVAYTRVATAMTQTTLIAGLGLSAFAMSTFTPTQRFGTLMLFLLAAALIGDLIVLPAILASPLGKYFSKIPKVSDAPDQDDIDGPSDLDTAESDEELNLRLIGDDPAGKDSKFG